MKLSKIYSNAPKLFSPIEFNDGLNVILAEIHLPKNNSKDTHNLGKSLLGEILDFMLIKGIDKNYFLNKHGEIFEKFIFFLELQLLDGSFVTVCRSVRASSKVSLKKHTQKNYYLDLSKNNWTHYKLPHKKAIEILDSYLNLQDFTPKPWTYRKGISYFLRSQGDYSDIFQLKKFLGSHSDWKPFVAHLLGLDCKTITESYLIEEQYKEKKEELKKHNAKFPSYESINKELNKIENFLLIEEDKFVKQQSLIDELDFAEADKEAMAKLIGDYDYDIANCNNAIYRIQKDIERIKLSMNQSKIKFDVRKTEKLFREVGVLFPEQLKKDFNQLITFNKSITEERSSYLEQELNELKKALKKKEAKLKEMRGKRGKTLSFLNSVDTFDKYKKASDVISELKIEIEVHKERKKLAESIKEFQQEVEHLKSKRKEITDKIQANLDKQSADKNSLLSTIRLNFDNIIQRIIQKNATLDVAINNEDHLEFAGDLYNNTQKNFTSESKGHTYKKLMCVSFDMALLKANINNTYPRFVYHDGIFETLDDRKKITLMEIIREYNELGIQTIITTIDTDLTNSSTYGSLFEEKDIVLRLHDEGDSGRLFKLPAW